MCVHFNLRVLLICVCLNLVHLSPGETHTMTHHYDALQAAAVAWETLRGSNAGAPEVGWAR